MKFNHSFIVSVMVLVLSVSAQNVKPWQERYQDLQKQIENEARRAAVQEVTRQSVMESLGFSEPLVPAKSIAQVREEATARVQEKIRQDVGEEPEIAIYKEAEKLYPLYKIGDKVTFPGIRSDEADITGIIHQVDKNYIRVGRTRVRRADLPERLRNCTSETWVNEARNKYVKEKKTGLAERISILERKYMEPFFNQMMTAEGYVLEKAPAKGEEEVEDEKSEKTAGPRWITREEIFQRALEAKRADAFARIRPEVEKRILAENGFKFYKTENKWLPEEGDGAPSFWIKFKNRNN